MAQTDAKEAVERARAAETRAQEQTTQVRAEADRRVVAAEERADAAITQARADAAEHVQAARELAEAAAQARDAAVAERDRLLAQAERDAQALAALTRASEVAE